MISHLKKGLQNVELLKSYLKKYDSKRSVESKRFTVLTDISLTYYYNEQDYLFNPEDYIARIYLSDISILKKYITEKKELFGLVGEKYNLDIYTTRCIRRNKTKGARVFRFSALDKDSLISWYSGLEVARLNSIYQRCCDDYGKFVLPFERENAASEVVERRDTDEIDHGKRGVEVSIFYLICSGLYC